MEQVTSNSTYLYSLPEFFLPPLQNIVKIWILYSGNSCLIFGGHLMSIVKHNCQETDLCY